MGSGLASAADKKLHHDLDLTLDPSTSKLEATDRIEVSGHTALAIKLAPGLSLSEAMIGDKPVSPTDESGVLWIELPEDDVSSVTLSYEGTLESGESRGRLSPILSADGGFLPYGLGWLANGGAEDDRVTYELTVNVPAPYKVVATGKISVEREVVIDDGKGSGSYQVTFVADHPTEPPSVFAGEFQIDERDHDGIRLRTYFPADQQQLSATYLDQAASYIDLFEGKIGDYPYDGFSMIAAPLPVGMGFPGLTYISAQILRMPFMQTRSLAHEILHNWWANGVFIDYSEGNWAEGLTTYMADYALAETEGPDKAEEMRLGWLRDFSALPEERDQALTEFRSKGHDADQVIGYNKVALVLHMLKQEIGEEAFDQGLRTFWQEHKFQNAAWSDIQASFEAKSGKDLDAFFKPWLTTKGGPRLSLDRADIKEGSDGSFELDLQVSSDRVDYDLMVPVQIETENGSEQVSLRVREGVGSDVINIQEKPISIGIDQKHDLFRYLAADEAPPILRDVTLNQNALTMIATNGHEETLEIAKELAGRTLRAAGVKLADPSDAAAEDTPVMLIGLSEHVGPALSQIGITEMPETLKDRGTARSWVAKRQDAPPVLVVEAKDDEALGALLRPLPHYGRYSYLAFDGRKVVEKGVWPTGANALRKRLN